MTSSVSAPKSQSPGSRPSCKSPGSVVSGSVSAVPRNLAAAVVRFSALLRHQGLPVTLVHVSDATRALEHLDLGDRDEVYLGMRAVFVSRPEEIAAFDRCFAAFWRATSDNDRVLEALAPT